MHMQRWLHWVWSKAFWYSPTWDCLTATSTFQLSLLPCSGAPHVQMEKNTLIYYLGRRDVMSRGSAVCNISACPKLPGGNKYNYNREKKTSSVLKKDWCLVKDCCRRSAERGWKRGKHTEVSFTSVFVCFSEQMPSQPTKWERKPEDCKDALQHLPLGKAQPDILEVARKKGCWGLCWVSIVPSAISAPRQEVTLTVCRFTTFSLKSELFWRKGETKTKHKGIKKRSNVQRDKPLHAIEYCHQVIPQLPTEMHGWVHPGSTRCFPTEVK